MLVLTQADVQRLLPMDACMDVMTDALKSLARGDAVLPLRHIHRLPDAGGLLALMPAYVATLQATGLKAITVFPGNHGTAFDSHQGAVLLFDTQHGQLQAIVDATAITAIRTAAVSGVATRALARPNATVLAILGSGVQARSHLSAMTHARRITEVRVWSRDGERARRFADREAERHGVPVSVHDSVQTAVDGADIICTTTASTRPVLHGAWIASGTHINAVGASVATSRELDTPAVVGARVIVDRRESALNEAGDIIEPLREGAIDATHIAGELGEVLLGRVVGRQTPAEITLFKSLGLAIEDLAAAHYVHQQARALGVGVPVDLGGVRDDD